MLFLFIKLISRRNPEKKRIKKIQQMLWKNTTRSSNEKQIEKASLGCQTVVTKIKWKLIALNYSRKTEINASQVKKK